MATKSILKNVVIKDKNTSLLLLDALDNANNKKSKKVTFSKTVRTADKDMIKTIFGDRI